MRILVIFVIFVAYGLSEINASRIFSLRLPFVGIDVGRVNNANHGCLEVKEDKKVVTNRRPIFQDKPPSFEDEFNEEPYQCPPLEDECICIETSMCNNSIKKVSITDSIFRRGKRSIFMDTSTTFGDIFDFGLGMGIGMLNNAKKNIPMEFNKKIYPLKSVADFDSNSESLAGGAWGYAQTGNFGEPGFTNIGISKNGNRGSTVWGYGIAGYDKNARRRIKPNDRQNHISLTSVKYDKNKTTEMPKNSDIGSNINNYRRRNTLPRDPKSSADTCIGCAGSSNRATNKRCKNDKICCPSSRNIKCGRRRYCGVDILINKPITTGNANFGEWPWMVAIVKKSEGRSRYICNGVLIDSNKVLTVAQCVYGIPASQLSVRAGDHDLSNTNEPYSHHNADVLSVRIHFGYNNDSLHNDIALLTLETDIAYSRHILPICLPTNRQKFRRNACVVIGFGRLSSIEQVSKVECIDERQCENEIGYALGSPFDLHYSFLCAKDNGNICQNLGGSALACRQPDNSYALVGLSSWGVGCYTPEVFVRVQNYIDWIYNSHLNDIKSSTNKNKITDQFGGEKIAYTTSKATTIKSSPSVSESSSTETLTSSPMTIIRRKSTGKKLLPTYEINANNETLGKNDSNNTDDNKLQETSNIDTKYTMKSNDNVILNSTSTAAATSYITSTTTTTTTTTTTAFTNKINKNNNYYDIDNYNDINIDYHSKINIKPEIETTEAENELKLTTTDENIK